MREDECRIRRGYAAENLAGFRHVAINLLTNEKTMKAGIKRKRLKAALSADYLSLVLAVQGQGESMSVYYLTNPSNPTHYEGHERNIMANKPSIHEH